MSSPFPQNAGPKRGGGGMMILIIFAIGAFIIFGRGNPNAGGGAPGNVDGNDQRRVADDDLLDQHRQGSAKDTASSDWGMEDVSTAQRDGGTKPKNKKTQQGDWGMEEVDTQPADDGVNLQLSGQGKPEDQTSSQQGDWGMEEVEPNSGNNSKPKKTEQGDWGLEEVGSGGKRGGR